MFMGKRWYRVQRFTNMQTAEAFARATRGKIRVVRGHIEVTGSYWTGAPTDTCRDIKDYEVLAWERYIERRDEKARQHARS